MRSLPELREHCLPLTHFTLASVPFKGSFVFDWDIFPIYATVLISFTSQSIVGSKTLFQS